MGSATNLSVNKKYLSILAAAAFVLGWLLVALVTAWEVPKYWVRGSIADDLAWDGMIYLWYPLLNAAIAVSYVVARYATQLAQKKIGIIAFAAGVVVFYFTTLSVIHTLFLLTANACGIAYDWVYGAKHKE